MKACIVVPLFFAKRRRTFSSANDVLDLAKYTVDTYKKLDTGLPTDIIFVNNSPEEQSGTEFLNSVNGTKSYSGNFIVIVGDNIGMSYGAYNTAFKKFTDNYDLWCFTEDDIIYTGKDFLLEASKQLNEDSNIGFVAACGVQIVHDHGVAHAGAGCSTNQILKRVVEKYGKLPHSDKVANLTDNRAYKREQIFGGEVAFTKCYAEMGYDLVKMNCKSRPYVRWSNGDSDLLVKIDHEEWGSSSSVNP